MCLNNKCRWPALTARVGHFWCNLMRKNGRCSCLWEYFCIFAGLQRRSVIKSLKKCFKKFGGLKHSVSDVETLCFNRRNTVFQGLILSET